MTAAAGATGSGDLPCIAIRRTPANDVYLILSTLGMGAEAQRALADPLGFLGDHRAEARFVARYLEGRLEPPADPRAHPPADRPDAAATAPARKRQTTDMRRVSLLR